MFLHSVSSQTDYFTVSLQYFIQQQKRIIALSRHPSHLTLPHGNSPLNKPRPSSSTISPPNSVVTGNCDSVSVSCLSSSSNPPSREHSTDTNSVELLLRESSNHGEICFVSTACEFYRSPLRNRYTFDYVRNDRSKQDTLISL